jgi:manganese transport protein
MRFTNEKAKMGRFANPLWVRILGWTTTAIIIVLNAKLLFDQFVPDAALKVFYGFFGLPVPSP